MPYPRLMNGRRACTISHSSPGERTSTTSHGEAPPRPGKAPLRSVRDFARKQWPLRGSPADVGHRGERTSQGNTTRRSGIADRAQQNGELLRRPRPLAPASGDEVSALADALIRSPYSGWSRSRGHPIVRGDEALRPRPALLLLCTAPSSFAPTSMEPQVELAGVPSYAG